MAKFIPPGTVIGPMTSVPSSLIIHNPLTDRMSYISNFQGESISGSAEYTAIPGTSSFISGKLKETEFAIYHNDGTITPLSIPGGAVVNKCEHCCVSLDGSTIAWVNLYSDRITVFDVAAATLTSYIDVGHNITTASNLAITLNDDGSIVMLVSWNNPVKTYDTATGNNLFTDATVGNYATIVHNSVLDKWLLCKHNLINVLDTATWTYDADAPEGVPAPAKWCAMPSPDGSMIAIGSTTAYYSKVIDCSDNTLISSYTGHDRQARLLWASNSKAYAYIAITNDIIEYTVNNKVFESPKVIGMNPIGGDYPIIIGGGKWEITKPMSDTSEETEFVVTVWDESMSDILGIASVADGATTFTVPCSTSDPVTVVIQGRPRDIHQTDTTYLLGDIITVKDTNYTYECTTGGTTAGTKPAYPTTGTISDGDTVFTVRSKIAEPIIHTHVIPTIA